MATIRAGSTISLKLESFPSSLTPNCQQAVALTPCSSRAFVLHHQHLELRGRRSGTRTRLTAPRTTFILKIHWTPFITSCPQTLICGCSSQNLWMPPAGGQRSGPRAGPESAPVFVVMVTVSRSGDVRQQSLIRPTGCCDITSGFRSLVASPLCRFQVRKFN